MSRLAGIAEAQSESLEQAAEWFAILQDDAVSTPQREQWRRWLAASAANRQAWRRVECIDQKFHSVQTEPARRALRAAERGRRRFVSSLAGLAIAAPLVWSAWQQSPLRYPFADLRTEVGEVRSAGWGACLAQHRYRVGPRL